MAAYLQCKQVRDVGQSILLIEGAQIGLHLARAHQVYAREQNPE